MKIFVLNGLNYPNCDLTLQVLYVTYVIIGYRSFVYFCRVDLKKEHKESHEKLESWKKMSASMSMEIANLQERENSTQRLIHKHKTWLKKSNQLNESIRGKQNSVCN